MTKDTMKEAAVAAGNLLFNDWVDAIEDGVRSRVRGFSTLELDDAGAILRMRDWPATRDVGIDSGYQPPDPSGPSGE